MLALAPTDAHDRPILRCARFDGATFLEPIRFAGVAFSDDASFDRATFEGDVSFDDAVCTGQIRFGSTRFRGFAGFARVRFENHAWFSGASFVGDVDFEEAQFAGPAWFGATHFASDALFQRVSFAYDAAFDEAIFGCHTVFADAVFRGQARLDTATFTRPPRYDRAEFRGAGGAPQDAARQATWAGAPLASWPLRAGAALLDHAVPAALCVAAIAVAALLRRLDYSGSGPLLVSLAAAIAAAGFLIVRNLVDQGRTGQTTGKRRLGLSLVRQRDGQPTGVRLSLLRYGLHAVDTLPALLGWLAPLWTSTSQTFSDRLTTTLVVRHRGWDGPGSSSPADARPSAGFS